VAAEESPNAFAWSSIWSFDFKMLFRDVNLAPAQGADFRSSQPGKELNCDKRKEL